MGGWGVTTSPPTIQTSTAFIDSSQFGVLKCHSPILSILPSFYLTILIYIYHQKKQKKENGETYINQPTRILSNYTSLLISILLFYFLLQIRQPNVLRDIMKNGRQRVGIWDFIQIYYLLTSQDIFISFPPAYFHLSTYIHRKQRKNLVRRQFSSKKR